MDSIKKLEIEFRLPVEINDEDKDAMLRLATRICQRNCPKGWKFWPASFGSKPLTAAGATAPTFDDSYFFIDCAAVEMTPEDIAAKTEK